MELILYFVRRTEKGFEIEAHWTCGTSYGTGTTVAKAIRNAYCNMQ